MIGTKDIAAQLRRWAETQDAPQRAAFEVLDEQGHWLRNKAFIDACVHEDEFEGVVYISWWQAAEAEGELTGSSGEMAVLRFALFLAQDPVGLSSLDSSNRAIVVREFARALGVAR
ncbi:hypothetical protein [Amycolatopsis jiangsuensis]|uniref:Uncharacterized protein n=1 Tax=Amycolatopsis jiangsuensis TaxID=1181879 RepID=A0A840J865_9PSEU|nr:hypothetical protein [Amycolatopsis jiangsuensis]MBB4689795.1 hypothetical protein [Amycolatopsis jiangsuensis]